MKRLRGLGLFIFCWRATSEPRQPRTVRSNTGGAINCKRACVVGAMDLQNSAETLLTFGQAIWNTAVYGGLEGFRPFLSFQISEADL